MFKKITIFLAVNKCQIFKHGALVKRHGKFKFKRHFKIPAENHL